MAGTKKPRARKRRGHGQGPGLAAEHGRARSVRPVAGRRRPRPTSASPSDRWRSARRARRRSPSAPRDQLDGGGGRGGDRGRQRGREDERAGAVDEQVAQRPRRRRRTRPPSRPPCPGSRSGRRARRRAAAQSPRPAGTEDAEGVGFVHDQDAVGRRRRHRPGRPSGAASPSMLNSDSVTRRRRRNWAPAASRRARGGGVAVGVDGDPGARQAAAIDQAGVVEGVRDDEVVAAGQRGQDAEVGLVAGREDEGGRAESRNAARVASSVAVGGQSRRRPAGTAEAPKPSRAAACGSGGGEGRVGSKAEIVVGAERQHGRAADVEAGRGSCPPPPGRRAAGRSPASASSSASSRVGSPHAGARMFHVEQLPPQPSRTVPRGTASRGDDLDERAAGRRSRPPGRSASGRASAAVSTNTRPPGPDQLAPRSQPLRGRQRRPRDRHVERARPSPWRRPRRARRGPTTRSPQAELADGGPQERRLLGDRLDTADGEVRPSSASGIAGRPPPLPTSIARAGCSSLRASAKASGKCSLTSTSIDARRGQVDARVPAQQRRRRSATAPRPGCRRSGPSTPPRARAPARPRAARRPPRCLPVSRTSRRTYYHASADRSARLNKFAQAFCYAKNRIYSRTLGMHAAADRGSAGADDPGRRQRRSDAPDPRSQPAPRGLRGARGEQRRGGRRAPRRSPRPGHRRRRRCRRPRFLPAREAGATRWRPPSC